MTEVRVDPAALLRERAPDVKWAARVVDVTDGTVHCDLDSSTTRSIASVGKVLVLDEVARRLAAGTLDGDLRLRRTEEDRVADSGLWQHLGVDALSVLDLAVLVGAVSDNLATNVLLRHLTAAAPSVDVPAVKHALLSADGVTVHDRVRDRRGPLDPPRFASGSMAALCRWATRTAVGAGHGGAHNGLGDVDATNRPPTRATTRAADRVTAARVETWLQRNTDRSMVSSAFFQDPLAPAGDTLVVTKTGSDPDVRCEAGYVVRASTALAFAVSATMPLPGVEETATESATSSVVCATLEAMQAFGRWLDATLAAGRALDGSNSSSPT